MFIEALKNQDVVVVLASDEASDNQIVRRTYPLPDKAIGKLESLKKALE